MNLQLTALCKIYFTQLLYELILDKLMNELISYGKYFPTWFYVKNIYIYIYHI